MKAVKTALASILLLVGLASVLAGGLMEAGLRRGLEQRRSSEIAQVTQSIAGIERLPKQTRAVKDASLKPLKDYLTEVQSPKWAARIMNTPEVRRVRVVALSLLVFGAAVVCLGGYSYFRIFGKRSPSV